MLHIPAQMSDLLGMTIKGQTKLNLELIGSEEPLAIINKMVNKIIICIITAALLVGSCLICTTDMTPKILGIPALGMLGFFASIVLGGWLMWKILRKNRACVPTGMHTLFVLKTIEWRSIRVCLMHGVRWLDWMNLISHCLCGHSEENLGSAKRGMSFLRCCKPSLHRWFY